ncbi:Mediator of RNA polymerase II transcription subunit 25 [Eumeta japonica]|uniref:Mediator of RNA polymerase II transcription subunit 25 n=1 Tax=Eumeta variegata TaxID=151549 RepID=A0A4C1V751_EUMVA|nr:Mediator of RNA polymerase II transcription subunit 25 [Eumeta japonica]
MSRMPLLGANEPSNTATPGAASNAVPSSSAADAEVPTVSAPAAGPSAPPTVPQRTLTWTGILVWVKKMGNQMQVIKHLRCQMSVSSNDMEPELKVDTWPKKMVMVLVPKQITMYGGGSYLKGSKSVVFHLQPNEAVQALTKVMLKGFVGYVHFGPKWASPQCDIKMLLLLYSIDKKVHYGFIPNKQTTFIERLKTVSVINVPKGYVNSIQD